jgi:hypothetical protein
MRSNGADGHGGCHERVGEHRGTGDRIFQLCCTADNGPGRSRLSVRAQLFLVDQAHIADGKLYVLGGVINQHVPEPNPMGIAGVIRIPWDETNSSHELRITLESADGKPVVVNTLIGAQPFVINAKFELGRPPGVLKGTEFSAPFAMNFIRPPLTIGRYLFKISLDDAPIDELHIDIKPAGG